MKRNFIKYAVICAIISAFSTACTEIDESIAVNADYDFETTDTITQMTTTTYNDTDVQTFSENHDDTEVTSLTEQITDNDVHTDTDNNADKIETVQVEAISLSTYDVDIEIGKSKMPIVTMSPANAEDKSEIWTSSDESVATVDSKGNILGIAEGKCIVTVTSAVSPDVYAEINVAVTAAAVKKNVEITYIQGILVVNKTYALPADYAPNVDQNAKAAFDKMQTAAAAEGLDIYISSGYRSYDYQDGLYNRYVQSHGKSEADRFSARAGHSEHQTGLAFDLNSIEDEFKDTSEGKWVALHAHEYGFIIRYPEGKESITGYMYEPWHIRYLGTDTAKSVYESGLTLEEYLGITSSYSN